MKKDFEMQANEEQFNERLWEEVMSDFFPDASTEEEIENELDDIWND